MANKKDEKKYAQPVFRVPVAKDVNWKIAVHEERPTHINQGLEVKGKQKWPDEQTHDEI